MENYYSYAQETASYYEPTYSDGNYYEDVLFYNNANQNQEKQINVIKEEKKPLLVLVEDEGNRTANSFDEYEVEVVPVSNLALTKPVEKAENISDANSISLSVLKINFRPKKSDLSVKTMKWLKEFSSKVSADFDNIVEIKVSPNLPALQIERLLMLKGILNDNGVYDEQIRIIANRKPVDSIVVKVIEKEEFAIPEKSTSISEIENQPHFDNYYYYY